MFVLAKYFEQFKYVEIKNNKKNQTIFFIGYIVLFFEYFEIQYIQTIFVLAKYLIFLNILKFKKTTY